MTTKTSLVELRRETGKNFPVTFFGDEKRNTATAGVHTRNEAVSGTQTAGD